MTADPDAVREDVKARYAEAARAVSAGEAEGCGSGSCCATLEVDSAKFGEALYDAEQRAGLPDGSRHGEPRVRQPDRGRRAARGRDGARPRLGRRHRRAALGAPRRPDRRRLRPRHDRGDARARPAQQGRGGSDERPLPARRDREHPAAGRERRRRDLELRHQPLDGQGAGAARDRPRAPARRPGRRQRRRRRGPALTRASGPSAAPGWAASPARSRSPSTSRASRRPGSRTSRSRSRTRSPTACTERSCGRSSRESPRRELPLVRAGGGPMRCC